MIARLIGVEGYGVASTILILVSFVQLCGDLSLDRLIVQDRRGDEPSFVAAVYSLILLRGIILAAVLFLFAKECAAFLGYPDLAWACRLLALVPLMTALMHPDMIRFQRHMNFSPAIFSELLPVVATLVMVWPMAIWLEDYRVVLVVVLVETAMRAGLSHLLAERAFSIRWNRDVAIQAIRFGGPLVISGLLVFATLQGDRIVVANHFSAFELGLFSAALSLAMTPSLVAATVAMGYFLPLLARVQDDADLFYQRASFCMQAMLVAGALTMCLFGTVGPPLFQLLFGDDYMSGASLVALIGMVFAMRLCRAGPTTVAMSKGATVNLLISNICRVSVLPVAVYFAAAGVPMANIILIGLLGELLALAASMGLLVVSLRLERLLRELLPALLITLALSALILKSTLDAGPVHWKIGVALLVALLISCKLLRVTLWTRILARYQKRQPAPDRPAGDP